ncbi:hypothetical protein Syun_002774 [Stephania yunnanensis]|uniref:NAC domain-containing protein n=1 Tax=Stephania yunnanensis TaxID=152371 RepID=A0AAP0Q937_9MAGN
MEDDDASAQLIKREDNNCIDLPPGFRFHPTDEEIITHYLLEKVLNSSFSATAVGEVDLNKCEPWDLPRKAKMGEKEWYFFCLRDRKYPSGIRTNRATEAGYWKATGKDREIFKGKDCLVGMKKTLVFYRGRAPKGEKTNWVMNEYRLDGKLSSHHHALPNTAMEAWVVCKVFHKRTQVDNNSSSSNTATLYLPRMNSFEDDDDDDYRGRQLLDSNNNYYGAAPIMSSSNFMKREVVVYNDELSRESTIKRTVPLATTCDDNNIHHHHENYLQAIPYYNVVAPNSSSTSRHHQFDVVGIGSSDFGYLPRQPISSTSSNLAASSSSNDQRPLIIFDDNKMNKMQRLPCGSSTTTTTTTLYADDHHVMIDRQLIKMSPSVSQDTAAWGAAGMNHDIGMEPPSSSSSPVVDLEYLWNC